MAKRSVLNVKLRKVTGRKVKNLRQQGILPVSLYGNGIKSLSLQAKEKEIVELFNKVGETGLVDVNVEDTKKTHAVLLKNPQYHPVTDRLIHIDLYQVDLSQKVTVSVPVELVGESSATEGSDGILVQSLSEIEIETLPVDLPEKFTVDVSGLKKIDDIVTISDLKIDREKINIRLDEEQVIAKIEEIKEEEVEEVASVETEVIGESDQGDGEAGEGEEKSSEDQVEEKEEADKKE